MLLFSSLGNGKGYIVHLHIQFKRYDDFAGSALISFTHLNNAPIVEVLLSFRSDVSCIRGEGLVDASVCDMQIVDIG